MAIFSPSLRPRLKYTIHVASLVSRTAYGDGEYGPPRPLAAHQEKTSMLTTAFGGTERQTTHLVITEEPILPTDRVWLDGEDSTDRTLARNATAVEDLPSPDLSTEPHHYETMIGDTFRRRTR